MSPRRSRNPSALSGLIALAQLIGNFLKLPASIQAAQRKIDEKNLRMQNAELRLEERKQKNLGRQEALKNKMNKQLYLEDRIREVESLNQGLSKRINDLRGVLQQSLETNPVISFDKLRGNEKFQTFHLPVELEKEAVPVRREEYLAKTPKPTILEKLIPGWEKRHQKTLQEAEKRFEEYENKFNAYVAERNNKIAKLTEDYEIDKSNFELKARQHNQEIDEFEAAYRSGHPAAIKAYCSIVLEHSKYPDGFPREFRVTYASGPKELVAEYELPTKDVVPTIAEYKYVKTRDAIDEKPGKLPAVKELYQDVVMAVCLRTLHELFEADQENYLDVIVFNGFVRATDLATGKDIRPYLLSIRAIKKEFNEINLAKVDKRVCLRNLGAQVSPQPDELMAVKPVVNFDMVDKRFIDESDVISTLDARPNLMDLNPYQFENLVNNLFSKMGFEAKLTRSTRDGGIDVIAFDPRPILGGKVVIQAKRYKNVVGVEAVRDLYGSMQHERAGKGILVTTSHYGTDAYSFAKDKPIELIDGGGLLYLLEQNGYKAKIIFPQDQ